MRRLVLLSTAMAAMLVLASHRAVKDDLGLMRQLGLTPAPEVADS